MLKKYFFLFLTLFNISSTISKQLVNLPIIKAIIDEIILEMIDNDKEVNIVNSQLLWYFSDTISSVYKKQFIVKSNNNSNKYIEKFKEKWEKGFI